MTDITIPESTLRELVASQLAVKFSDPEIISSFVSTILESRMDNWGRVSVNPKDPTLLRWAIENVVKQFVSETANAWLKERHDELVSIIGEELSKSDVLRRLAKETAVKVRVV